MLNSKSRAEGEPLNGVSIFLEKATLPITSILDKVFISKKDIARLTLKESKPWFLRRKRFLFKERKV
jgi:hypothetical protein